MTELLDTNVLVRYLVGDVPKQQQQAKRWFGEGERGKRKIVVKPLVVAEVCFVLESFYQQSRKNIASAMEVFLAQRWLRVEEREVLLAVWKWYREGYILLTATYLPVQNWRAESC